MPYAFLADIMRDLARDAWCLAAAFLGAMGILSAGAAIETSLTVFLPMATVCSVLAIRASRQEEIDKLDQHYREHHEMIGFLREARGA